MQTEDDQIDLYLQGLDASALRQLVLEASLRDEGLRQKLRIAATASGKKGLRPLRKAVKLATKIEGFLGWGEAGNYANGLEDLAQLLANRIDDGDAALVELIEEAISCAEDALKHIDDSGGEVMPAILELRKVHLAACDALRPDPVALANRLYDFQMHGEWDTFHDVLPDYVGALGEQGLRTYRERVHDEWKSLPRLGPEHYRGEWSSQRFRVESAMRAIARHENDFELLVAVHEKNLSSPSAFLSLAKLFRDAGRDAEALAWVEQGIAAFPEERSHDLLSAAIELHLTLGQYADAERLAWQRFDRAPGSEAFFRLMEVADAIERRETLRGRALDHLWEKVVEDESPERAAGRNRWEKPLRGSIVSIFLREGDAEAMWAAFCGGQVDVGLWERVADVRAKSHHEEAIALYKCLLPYLVEAGSRSSHYAEAFAIVKKIRALRETHKQMGMFGDELAEVRLEWKRKRNFMKMLDGL